MKRIFKRLLGKNPEKKKKRGQVAPLPAPAVAQIEVTTRCNFKCTMCPRTYYAGEKNLDFSWDLFERFSAFFPKLRLVHLQGWGEPLLHPQIFDMAALVRQKNVQVAFTTNGSLLDERAIAEILHLPMQHVTVSIAGAEASVHNAIRVGSDLDALLGRVSNLVAARKRRGLKEPVVHLSYMVTRSSVSGLPEMVRKACEIGVDRLVAPNLDCPVTRAEDDLRIFGFEKPDQAYQNAIDEAQIVANKRKLRLNVYPLTLSDDVVICELNPLEQFFVNVHGDVAPCTYASVMGRTDYCRYFLGEEIPTSPLVFGSLAEENMDTIWNAEQYRRFRRQYANRMQAYRNVAADRTDIRSMFELEAYFREIDKALSENPVPGFCLKCYKAYGA
ncbi:MAG: radical SAM/SPASM domain-containing protein [Desulfosalsimonadaceae bacterium]